MQGYLRQSTASQSRLIGPFLDDVDFKSEETALTIANTDIKLRANGTTLANKNSGGGTHQANGCYSVTWDATDTANVGELFFTVKVAGALPVFGTYVVVEEAVYDQVYATAAAGAATPSAIAAVQADTDDIQTRLPAALVGGRMDANVGAINGATGGVGGLDRSTRTIVLGTVTTGGTTTSIPTSSLAPAAAVTDQFKGRVVIFDEDTATANLRGQAATITASTAGGVLTCTTLTTAPVSGDTLAIL